jgi:hypothetical protein
MEDAAQVMAWERPLFFLKFVRRRTATAVYAWIMRKRGFSVHKVILVDHEERIRHELLETVDWKRHGFEIVGEAKNDGRHYTCMLNRMTIR